MTTPIRHRPAVRTAALAALLCVALASPAARSNEAPQPEEHTTMMTRLQELSQRATEKASQISHKASDLVINALGMLGIRYKYGGTSPDSGLDCSGLVRYVFKESWGKDLPRTSEEMARMGQKVDTKDLQPGDLVFYNTLRRGFSHVGIYLGDNKFIHSPSPGGEVRIESMDMAYWKKRFNGARRVKDGEAGSE